MGTDEGTAALLIQEGRVTSLMPITFPSASLTSTATLSSGSPSNAEGCESAALTESHSSSSESQCSSSVARAVIEGAVMTAGPGGSEIAARTAFVVVLVRGRGADGHKRRLQPTHLVGRSPGEFNALLGNDLAAEPQFGPLGRSAPI